MSDRSLKAPRMHLSQSEALRSTIKKLYIYVVLLVIVVVFSVVKLGQVEMFGRGHFLSADSIINLLRSAVPIMTLSGAFTLLMISGHIDLSVGSAMSLSAVVFALMIRGGFPFLPGLLLTLIAGVAMGTLNGCLVMRLRITPVIATLVTLNMDMATPWITRDVISISIDPTKPANREARVLRISPQIKIFFRP